MNNQDKLLELMEELMAGLLDINAKRRKANEIKLEINQLVNNMHDSIDLKIGESMPAEYLSYELLNNTSYRPIHKFDSKKPEFNMTYFLDNFEHKTGISFYDAIRNDDRFEVDKKEEFINYIDTKKNQVLNVEEAMDIVKNLTPYMSEVNGKTFDIAIKEMESISLPSLESKQSAVREVLFSGTSEPSRFEEIGMEVMGRNQFAKEFDTLRESKKGIIGFGTKELNDMSFISVMHEANLEKEKSVQEICQKTGISQLCKDNRLFRKVNFGDIRVGTKTYNLQEYASNDPEILRRQIKSNYVSEEFLKDLKNERFSKQKESRLRAEQESERIKQEAENRAIQDEKKKADNQRVNDILSKAEKIKIDKIDSLNIGTDSLNGTRKKEAINKAYNNLIDVKKSYDLNAKDINSFILSDLNKEENINKIKEWGSKQTDTKEMNALFDLTESVKELYPEASKVYEIASEQYRQRRQEKVLETINKKADALLSSVNVHTRAIDNILDKQDIDAEEFYKVALEDRIVKVKDALDTFNALSNNVMDDKEFVKGNINKDNFFVANIYLKSDTKKIEDFVKNSPLDELKSSVEKLDFIQAKEVIGIKNTYKLVYDFAKSRSDFDEIKFKRIDNVLDDIKPKQEIQKEERSYGRERTLFDS